MYLAADIIFECSLDTPNEKIVSDADILFCI